MCPVEPDPERRLYAIGDIHGRVDLLARLIDRIRTDLKDDSPETGGADIVFLGDYIDRGDRSAEVLAALIALDNAGDLSVRFLKGNHEAMLLRFLDDPEDGVGWLRHGGLATLMSYGIRGLSETARPENCDRAARELRSALGEHEVFLRDRLELKVKSGNVLCVHAACDPALTLEAQTEHVLLWGHEDFLKMGGPPDMLVVHGHTVMQEPDRGPNRLGIDTGAYFSGRLTAARIELGSIRFLTS